MPSQGFVMVATADWDAQLWTNKQHSAVALAELGNRVLYVESLGLRPPGPTCATSSASSRGRCGC